MKNDVRAERRFMLQTLRPYRFAVVLVVFCSFLASLFGGISIGMLVPLLSSIQEVSDPEKLPRVIRYASNLLSRYPVETQIYLSIVLVVISMLLKNTLLGMSIYYGYRVSSRIAADLRTRATHMLLGVGLGFYHRTKAGELIEKSLYNTASLEDLTRHSVEMVAHVITFLVLFSLLFILSWQLTIITVIIGAVFMWMTSAYTRRLSTVGDNFATSSRELLSNVHENISGIQLIKSFAREERQFARIQKAIDRHQRNTLQLNFRNYVVHLLTDVLGAAAIGGLFVVTMQVYEMEGKVLIVLLLPFVYVITQIIPVLKHINMDRAVIVSRWPFVRIVADFVRMDNKPVVPNGHKTFCGLKSAIRFDRVTFSYREDAPPALRDVSFSIPRGKTTAVVGQSGSGKSTIVALLLRFYDPQHGVISVDGEPLPDFDLSSYRQRVGVVSQDVFIFNDSVKHNIGFGADGEVTDEQIVRAARLAGAHEFIMALPAAYDTVLGDRGVKLSGGQRQRISIARAVLRDPEILVLDEATSSLDTRMEKLIHEAIVELGRNRTMVIIAHRLSTIRNADEIIVLKEGQVQETGTAAELLRKKGEYYLLAQMDREQPSRPEGDSE
jgi:ATP-binding cassette, subfamily B, bacterial MsbA